MSFGMIRNEIPISGDTKPTVVVGKDWFRFFANLFTSTTSGNSDPIVTLTGASPYSYQAMQRGQVIVSGGTVSTIELTRDGKTFYTTGLTAGVFPLSANDLIRITFSVSPTTRVFMPL